MTDRYLFGTAVPVLLDGGRSAGRLARMLYTRFGLEAHWFGAKGHLLLSVYARKHRALPFTEENDAVTLRLLRAFAREHGSAAGILALIPCSPEADPAGQARAERQPSGGIGTKSLTERT